MGTDRRPWAYQRKRVAATPEQDGAQPDASAATSSPANPSTPQDDRGFCLENGLGRQRSSGGIDGGASGRRPWVNQGSSYLEVTRSPSYLRGAAGLTLPASPAPVIAIGTPQQPKAVSCSPSSTTVMESPPAPVRTGRPAKPRRGAGAAKVPPLGGNGVTAAAPLGGANGQHLLPPPAIQREASGSFLKGGDRESGAGVASKSPSASRDPSLARQQEEKEELLSFGRNGGGGGGGGDSPLTPDAATSTPRLEGRSNAMGSGEVTHVPKTPGIAFPATPRMTKDPETSCFASTPRVCSPPAPCHRGISGGGGKSRASSRLSVGVDSGIVGRHSTAAGDDDHARKSCSVGWPDGESRESGTTHPASHPRQPAPMNQGPSLTGRCDSDGVDGVTGAVNIRESPRDLGDGAETYGSKITPGKSAEKLDCWRERLTRKEQLLDSSSAERFSEDLEACDDSRRGQGSGDGAEACSRECGVSRRRRRKRRPVERRNEESLIDFEGRMAAIAFATRLTAASAATTAAASTPPAFVVATPPHPISVSAPPLPRRRLLSAASPSPTTHHPGAYGHTEDRCPERGDSSTEEDSSAQDRDALALEFFAVKGNSVPVRHDDASAAKHKDGLKVAAADSSRPLSSSAWLTPAKRGEKTSPAAAAAAGVGESRTRSGGAATTAAVPTGGSKAHHDTAHSTTTAGEWAREEPRWGRSTLDPLTALKPSERTAPKTRPWPDFERIRYEPPESEITTPLRRSDWKVPHGSAMRALAAALEEAAGSTACSSPADMRKEGRKSIRRRYQERADHFRLIQAARESSAGRGSAMLMVMRQRRLAEEEQLRAKEKREARAAWLKEKMLMRMLEGRKATFLAWARHATACRKAREMRRSREASLRLRVFAAWRGEALKSRRVRELVVKYLSSSKRAVFSAWKESTRSSFAVREKALNHLQGARKSCFYAWRDVTRKNLRRRELALEQSALARSALTGFAGIRWRFLRWKAWAGRRAAAKRMAQNAREAGLRRCFLALAENQLRLRHRLEIRRIVTLAAVFEGWRVGLGRLLRARLLPVDGEREMATEDGGGGGFAGSSFGADGWGFSTPDKESEALAAGAVGRERDLPSGSERRSGQGGDSGDIIPGGGTAPGARAAVRRSSVAAAEADQGDEVPSPLPPSAFFAATSGSRIVAPEASPAAGSVASTEARTPGSGESSAATGAGRGHG